MSTSTSYHKFEEIRAFPGHACQCRTCQPDDYPSGARQGPHHVAIRLGDYGAYAIEIDGSPCPAACEAIAGEHGLVVAFGEIILGGKLTRHFCAADREHAGERGACEQIRRGNVTWRRAERHPGDD